MIKEPTLCSQLISALGNPKRGLALYQGGKIAENMTNQVITELVQSQKFVISKELIEHSCEASFSKPNVLLDMLENAIPSFDNLWIEWDEMERQNYFEQYHKSQGRDYADRNQLPDRVGYHIKKFTDVLGKSYFLYQSYFKFNADVPKHISKDKFHNKFYAPTMCFSIDHFKPINFEEDMFHVKQLNEVPEHMRIKNIDEHNFNQFEMGQSLLAKWYVYRNMPSKFLNGEFEVQKLVNYSKHDEFQAIKEIFNRFSICQSASMHWQIPKWHFEKGYSTEEMKMHKDNLFNSSEGDARFIISVLSLINANITTNKTIQPDAKIIHTHLGKRVPRNEYKILNVVLKKNEVRKIYKSKYTGSKKRHHLRRGHFRMQPTKNGTKKIFIQPSEIAIANANTLGSIVKDYHFKKET